MQPAARGKIDDARQPAEVQQQPALAGMAKQQMIGQRGERHSLSAGGDVARAKIADGGDAGTFSDDGGHAEGERRGESAIGIVPYGVSRTADALHARETEAGSVGDL